MKAFIFLVICCWSICVAVIVTEDQDLEQANEISRKSKRSIAIPLAGQALQSTAQVLNHPIVAAALQKISMNALQTVASALNQVHQEELARKSEVEKTLDQMASIRAVTEDNKMPMLEDFNGSGDAEDTSGSGAESGDGDVTTSATEGEPKPTEEETNKKQLELKEVKEMKNKTSHHHHHHHHHRHHHHSKKSEKEAVKKGNDSESIDWSTIQNNTKVVGKIAQEANIPVKKLLAIFKSGASRSEIAKQTEELLNRTIESQADLAKLFETEEEEEKEKKHHKKKEKEIKNKKVSESATTNKKNQSEYEVPKNIPQNCGKLVKQYTDGELTLKDYLKELKICKKNEEVSQQLANTTPIQREAVATQTMIQQEAYNYALTSMKSFKPTAKEQANAVIARWRSNSFGEKPVTKGKLAGVPDAVKSFMNIQAPMKKIGKVEESSPTADDNSRNKENTEAAKSTISNNNEDNSASPFNENTNSGSLNDKDSSAGNPVREESTASFIGQPFFKKSTIPEAPVMQPAVPSTFMSKLHMLSGDTQAFIQQTNQESIPQTENAAAVPVSVTNGDEANPQKEITTRSDIFSNPTFTLNTNVPQHVVESPPDDESANENPLSNMPPAIKDVTSENIFAKSDIPSPIQKNAESLKRDAIINPQKTLLVTAPGQSNGITPVATSLADAVLATKSVVPAMPSNKAGNFFQSVSTMKQPDPISLLNGQEYAKESFLASLANPALQEIPVDTSLVAALQSLNGFDSTIVNDPKSSFLMASLQKRQVKETSKRHVKRETNEAVITRKHKKHRVNLLKHGKRDTNDKIKSAKPIERSKMSLPLVNSQPGPTLMDKIRDMGKVIATP